MFASLTDRVAIVTGASKGIGAATVRLLADHGARVAFCARGPEAVDALAGYSPREGKGSVHGFVADMADQLVQAHDDLGMSCKRIFCAERKAVAGQCLPCAAGFGDTRTGAQGFAQLRVRFAQGFESATQFALNLRQFAARSIVAVQHPL